MIEALLIALAALWVARFFLGLWQGFCLGIVREVATSDIGVLFARLRP